MMEAVSSPETSISFYQNTRRNIIEDSHFQPALRAAHWIAQALREAGIL
jgi:hypothetical protein